MCSRSAALMYFNPGANGDPYRHRRRHRPDAARARLETPLGRAGTKGPRLHDWCYLELADLEVEALNDANSGLWTRGLLIRRHIADGDLAFTTWCPAGTSIETLVAVEGHRWAIEDSFETAKNELVSITARAILAWLAPPRFLGDARLRHDGGDPPSRQSTAAKKNETPNYGKNKSIAIPSLIRWSIQEVRRIAIRLARKHIQPAHVIAWSLWRRAHQATAQRAHFKASRNCNAEPFDGAAPCYDLALIQRHRRDAI